MKTTPLLVHADPAHCREALAASPTIPGRRLLARRVPAAVLAATVLCQGCVVTTHSGRGHAPEVAITDPFEGMEASAKPESSPVDEERLASQPATIDASHILVQYVGAERAGPSITRTKEEAFARAQQVLTRARSGEDFAALAAEYSDEPGAAQRGGHLGRFPRDAMVPSFADAAFALDTAEVSDVVESPFGYHVILRHE